MPAAATAAAAAAAAAHQVQRGLLSCRKKNSQVMCKGQAQHIAMHDVDYRKKPQCLQRNLATYCCSCTCMAHDQSATHSPEAAPHCSSSRPYCLGRLCCRSQLPFDSPIKAICQQVAPLLNTGLSLYAEPGMKLDLCPVLQLHRSSPILTASQSGTTVVPVCLLQGPVTLLLQCAEVSAMLPLRVPCCGACHFWLWRLLHSNTTVHSDCIDDPCT